VVNMYFSHNVSYFRRLKDPKNPSKGSHFVTLEEIARMEEKKDILEKQNKNDLDQFLEQNFTPEELQFLKENWVPSALNNRNQ